MRRAMVGLMLLATFPGCGDSDPKTCRLEKGEWAIVALPDDPDRRVGEKLSRFGAWDAKGDGVLVNLGTRVVVVDDTGGPPKEEQGTGVRMVCVNVKDGEQSGRVLNIARFVLRPVPSR